MTISGTGTERAGIGQGHDLVVVTPTDEGGLKEFVLSIVRAP
jgi:hypothetical protein